MTTVAPSIPVPDKLVATKRGRPYNPIDEKHYLQSTGASKEVQAQPRTINFEGFELGKVHTLKLRVLNSSTKKQRFHFLNPSTAFFTLRHRKLGNVAPGMAETLYVDFNPTEFRYYYDCIRVHAQNENILIPIHAYPIMTKKKPFPGRIDFGIEALGETSERVVELFSEVPLDFEFEVSTIEQHPAFRVSPTTGIVPGLGSTKITLEFSPVGLLTCQAKIRFNLSQFNFQPIHCTLVGTCTPGPRPKDTGLPVSLSTSTAAHRLASTYGRGKAMDILASDLLNTVTLPTPRFPDEAKHASSEAIPVTGPPAEGLNDTVLRLAALSMTGHKGASAEAVDAVLRAERRAKPKTAKKRSKENRMMDTAPVSSNLPEIRRLQDMLMTVPGKIRVKDLKRVIAENREVAIQSARTEVAGGSLYEPHTTVQMKQLMFEQMMQKVKDHDRSKDVKWFTCLGDSMPMENHLNVVLTSRQFYNQTIESQKVNDDLNRTTVVVDVQGRPVRLKEPRVESTTPTFSVLGDGSVWSNRLKALARFRQAAYSVVIQKRASDRLNRLRAFLRSVNGDKDKIAQRVKEDSASRNLAAAGASIDVGDGVAEGAAPDLSDDADLRDFDISIGHITSHSLLHQYFPMYREREFRENVKVEEPPVLDFEEWNAVPLKVPRYFRGMSYSPTPAAGPYAQSNIQTPMVFQEIVDGRVPNNAESREMRSGADFEYLVRMPRKSKLDIDLGPSTLPPPTLTSDADDIPTVKHIIVSGPKPTDEMNESMSLNTLQPGSRGRVGLAAKEEGIGVSAEIVLSRVDGLSDVYVEQFDGCTAEPYSTLKGPIKEDLDNDVEGEEVVIADGSVRDISGVRQRRVSLSEMCPPATAEYVESQFPKIVCIVLSFADYCQIAGGQRTSTVREECQATLAAARKMSRKAAIDALKS